ncbi:MAG: response regulator transcription factor [Chitinophagaceae bacterium]
MSKTRVIIADDERAARQELKRLLLSYPDLEVVAETADGDDTRAQILALKPDLVFLDIQMPGLSGFELLESLDEVPEIIFVTAFDKYAVQAFETNALDYLLKPVRDERFTRAIEKLRQKLATKKDSNNEVSAQVFVKDGQHCYFVQWRDVYLIESLDNYAALHFSGKKVLLKSSLNQLEQKLDNTFFFRANRAQIVNTRFVQQMISIQDGRIELLLHTGDRVLLSERQSIKFRNRDNQ